MTDKRFQEIVVTEYHDENISSHKFSSVQDAVSHYGGDGDFGLVVIDDVTGGNTIIGSKKGLSTPPYYLISEKNEIYATLSDLIYNLGSFDAPDPHNMEVSYSLSDPSVREKFGIDEKPDLDPFCCEHHDSKKPVLKPFTYGLSLLGFGNNIGTGDVMVVCTKCGATEILDDDRLI